MAAKYTYDDIDAAIRDYCERSGWKETTLGLRVFGNARIAARIRTKRDKLDEVGDQLMEWIKNNPPCDSSVRTP